MSRRALLAGGCLALVATAACGTTVSGRALDSATGTGLQPGPGVAASSGAAGTTDVVGQAPVGQQPGPGLAGAPAGSSTMPSVPGASASLPPVTTAVVPSKKPLVIGVITSGNAGALLGALGVNANYGDQRKQSQAIADYLNAHGGIQGHPIKLTFYDYDTTGGGPGNAQAACAAFTQDQHAFASIGVAGMDDNYHACAAKAGMLVLTDGDIKSAAFFKRFPTTVLISDAVQVRRYAAMVYALHNEGFFTPGAKIGLLYNDEPNDQQGIREGMKPALAKLGLKVSDEITMNPNDTSGYASAQSSAALKFQADGITHILFGAATAWTFDQTAAQQHYYPMQGVDSRQSPGLLMQTVDSPQSLVNTWGFGYQPVQDVDARHDPGPVSDRQSLCTSILKAAGQSASATRLSLGAALYLCDELFFARDALAGQPDTSKASFLRGVAALGSSYHSTLTFRTQFSASQHDGAQAYRPLRYKTDCSCFTYTGPARPFPRAPS
jgi:ABC-type branched-subunit amino acid transport system substrate-binding protein